MAVMPVTVAPCAGAVMATLNGAFVSTCKTAVLVDLGVAGIPCN